MLKKTFWVYRYFMQMVLEIARTTLRAISFIVIIMLLLSLLGIQYRIPGVPNSKRRGKKYQKV